MTAREFLNLAYVYARDEATRQGMLPRDDEGYVMDPVEALDEALEPQAVGVNDPERDAIIASLAAM